MREPKRWRETINPFDLKFKNFKLIKILGYPHARNDVFYVKGIYKNKNVYAYIKCSRCDNNFIKENEFLNNSKIPFKSEVIECDEKGKYLITRAKNGKKLSKILNVNPECSSEYLFEYGKQLAKMHKLDIDCDKMNYRKFFLPPSIEDCKKYGLESFRACLVKREPKEINECFCHGDMHYANVIWLGKKINAILDYELAGIGSKEYDIAWVLINRPGQKFLRRKEDIDSFLKGYKEINDFNMEYVKYYMGVIYLHFYMIGYKDEEYREYVFNTLKSEYSL